MIVALHSVLHDGAEADYEREHERIPPDLEASFSRLGIHGWSIWRSGRNLFHLVDCDDWLGAMTELENDPANLSWQAHIGRYVAHFVGAEGGAAGQVLPLVYSLRAQRTADATSVMYRPPSNSHKYGSLYARSVELQHNGAVNGTLLATFEKTDPAANPVFPIYRSTDAGASWTQISSVTDQVNGWGNRNGAFLYELPQQIGDMPAGTILCVGLSAPQDESAERLEVYKSNDQGQTWQYVSRIATAGSYRTTPIWEPHVIVANSKLIVYYSDERDKANNNQKIVHQTSTDGVNWGPVVNDVAPTDSALRPGMPVVNRMADGRYIMTFEVVGEPGPPNNFKISSNPESWNPTSLGTTIDHGGHPVNTVLPNGRILYNSGRDTDVLINSGNGKGPWVAQHTNVPWCYSRWLQYVHSTGRVVIMGSDGGFWGDWNVDNKIVYGDQDFGFSTGSYYKFVNRKSGKALGVYAGALGDGGNVVQWSDKGSADQAWQVRVLVNGNRAILNRNSGQALSISGASTGDGASAVQWVAGNGTNQQWELVAVGSYFKLKNANSGKVLSILAGSPHDGAQVVQWADTGSLDQQWSLVQV